VGSWGAAPGGPGRRFTDVTLTQPVRLSAGGDAVRLRLSNEFGDRPLRIGAASVTGHPVTFGGAASCVIPPGAPVLTDPVELTVPPLSRLEIRLDLPGTTPDSTCHTSAHQANLAGTEVVTSWFFLTGVAVHTDGAAVVALGDSITDGTASTHGADRRWPDLLAARRPGLGVVNAGIGGNRLLHDASGAVARRGQGALRRFDRDVAAVPGARWLLVLLGTNDLGHPGAAAPLAEAVDAAALVAGHRQLVARAHELGLRAYGGTVPPFGGHPDFGTPANEAARAELNAWLRTGGGYDAVVDVDAALRDPADPARLAPAYDSGDGLHPNDAGMAALAGAVPLSLFG
jgi:lysophospholipase L1-like esterase